MPLDVPFETGSIFLFFYLPVFATKSRGTTNAQLSLNLLNMVSFAMNYVSKLTQPDDPGQERTHSYQLEVFSKSGCRCSVPSQCG